MNPFCVVILETCHSTQGKKNLNTETEKSEQTRLLRFLYLCIKIPAMHVPQNILQKSQQKTDHAELLSLSIERN